MYFGNGIQNGDLLFNEIKFPNSREEKILDAIIDNELKFEPHIKNMCKKAARTQMQPQRFPANGIPKIETVRYGLEIALYRAPRLWSLVPPT